MILCVYRDNTATKEVRTMAENKKQESRKRLERIAEEASTLPEIGQEMLMAFILGLRLKRALATEKKEK